MQIPGSRWQKHFLAAAFCLMCLRFVTAAEQPNLSKAHFQQLIAVKGENEVLY
jgi:hypothetical protein